MYDGSKIISGLVIFLLLMTFPFWYNGALGKAQFASSGGQTTSRPQLQQATGKCVEGVEYMRTAHMDLLNSWREWFVRDNDRTYTTRDGRTFQMSLSGTCLKQCHSNKAEFCDKCHSYTGVDPYCFDCHLIPKGN